MVCTACPRRCGIDRDNASGYCGEKSEIRIAKTMLHMWEEPCISGDRGSGAIFFSGCSLRCVYCQNREISHLGTGEVISTEELAQIMLTLQENGAHNINLVTPTHFSWEIRCALDLVMDKLKIPVVYNTSGYELDTEIEKMRGYVDVFLTDMKYFSPELSLKYSGAEDYFEHALASLKKMLEICPEPILDKDGIMTKGVIIRHLTLPGQRRDSIQLLTNLAKEIDVSKVRLSLMCQYTPDFCPDTFKELKRRVTTFEYQSAVDCAVSLGYKGYTQDKSSSTADYTPKFDYKSRKN
ncbi:MAG: radical SAM protein [Clostridia bacterium]|nr:radical SAM protein [Clostridia bacterium]